MSSPVLIVEDDAPMGRILADGLRLAGYSTVIKKSGEEALSYLAHSLPRLILLDVNLGGISGFQVLEWLRQTPNTRKIPVILLTARDQESEKVKGLRLGADDYVTKPFSEKELIARVETVLRRAGNGEWAEPRLESGSIVVDLDKRQVTVKGKPVDLRVLEFDLLCLFLKSPERVHSYTAIADRVWGEDRVATRHTIAVTLSRLREKLGAAGNAIEPVAGIGYRFIPE